MGNLLSRDSLLLKLCILMAIIFWFTNGFAMSCKQTEDKSGMAAEYFSPYSVMATTAWWTSLGGLLASPRTDDEKRRLGWTDGLGGAAQLISGIPVLLYNACSGTYKGKESELNTNDISVKRFNAEKKVFYFAYGVGVGWNIANALQLENSNKWYYVGAVAISPFLVDGINRLIFNKHKLSPYSSLGFNVSCFQDGTPITQVHFRF